MPSFEQGDVIKVPFPYTNRPIRQQRPALVVSNGQIGEDRQLLWAVMITSAENPAWPNDIPFGKTYATAGLPAPSIIRPCKLATIEARHATKLGQIETNLLRDVVNTLQTYLGN